MKYIIKKLWPLILLLFISGISVMSGHKDGFLWKFLDSYFWFAIYVLAAGIAAHFIGNAFPRRFEFERGFFSTHRWEKDGAIYDELFRVKNWKDQSFDASIAFSSVSSKSLGLKRSPEEVYLAIQETCAAELTHWLLTLASPLMFLIGVEFLRFFFLVIYIISNLSDVIIQRYNRPRFVKVYRRLLEKTQNDRIIEPGA